MSIAVRNNLDLGLNQLLSALAENVAADPGTVTSGRVIYNTTQGKLKVGEGGSWVAFLVTTARLDQLQPPTAAVALNGQKISGLADGTAGTDAVTKQQLDGVAAGLDVKPSVRAASTANVSVASPGATIDGVALAAGERVLLKNQTTPAENGIYVYNGAAVAMTRAADMDAWAEVPGAHTFVEQGTVNADTGWVSTADQGGTLGTSAITWTQFSATAGAGGTVRKFAADITDTGSATQFTVNHALGSTDVQVQVWEATTNAWVITDVTRVDANNVRVDFAAAPVNGKVYRVVCMA